MFGDLKNKFKRNTAPSIRSVNSQRPQQSGLLSSSTPILSSTIPLPATAYTPLSARQKEKLPSTRKRASSVLSNMASNGTSTSIDEEEESNNGSTTSSSSASISTPPTPPVGGEHNRYPSNVSLPISMNSFNEFFLNHTHLKPGNNAELLSYDKTINLYRENAKKTNDPTIQCDLAVYLYESSRNANNASTKGKKAYIYEATKMLKTLSLRGHAESQYYLANIYASGNLNKPGKADFGNAFPLFVQAAKHQHVDAAYRAAKCYEDGLGCLKNKSKAHQYYKLAATLSHPGAMYRLGLANINGELGLQRNIRDGNKWLKRSAEAATPDYPHALHELGLLHEKGLGSIIFKDLHYSMQLYMQAAELGYSPSAYRLGECYEYGYLGCQKDPTSSIFYYNIAARQGNAEACFALSAWYLSGDKKKILPSEERALYWATVAAQMGFPKAEFALGYFAEVGIGRTKNLKEAAEWYKKAEKQGDGQAKKRLANLYPTQNKNTNTIPSSLLAAGEAR